MDGGFGLLVVGPEGRVLSADALAESLLATQLPPGSRLDLDSPLCRSFLKAGYSLGEALKAGQEVQGYLYGEGLAEESVYFRAFPLYNGENRVMGTIITLERKSDRGLSQALHFLGVSHDELLDQFPEGVFVVNTRWQVNYFNRKAEVITGYSADEALGKFCWEIFRSQICHQQCPMKVSLSTGETMVDQEVEILTKSGEKKLILVNTAQIKKQGKLVLGGIETFRDLTCQPPVEAKVEALGDIIGVSPQMQELIRNLPTIAACDSTVLIQGESGTGKEMVAQAIHALSPRKKGPFVAINCSAIPDTLLESELFGYERGAFTGAVSSKPGRFELARGGTLFLDEIGDLRPEIQVKLLRVLEVKAFMRVGGTRKIPLEARIIAATNKDLREAMRKGRFRDDLYYRLSTVPIYLPPLREKRVDIPILVKHYVEEFNRRFNKRIRGVDPKVMKIFCRYSWPGNVRELQHVMEYCFVFAKGPIITEKHLPPLEDMRFHTETFWHTGDLSPLEALEKDTIIKALEKAGGNKQEAARLLKISRSKLWRKMKTYHVSEQDFKKETE